jgi:hypothetical protein
MGTKESEEAKRPLGVLGCLMAGFETLGHNWWLLALPALLDLFLWLGPQLSIAPLMQEIIAFIKIQPIPDAEAAHQLAPLLQLLEQIGEQFNLFSLLDALPLLSPPSLLVQHAPGITSPFGQRAVISVTNVLLLSGWGVVLIPCGLLLGFVYLNSLAHSVQTLHPNEQATSDSADPSEAAEPPRHKLSGCNVALKLIRIFLFTAGLMAAGLVIVPVWLAVLATAAAVAEILLMVTWGLSLGIASFVILHLTFVIHGVLLGERGLLRAILESIALTRANFAAAARLVVATLLTYQGLGYIWSLPAGDSWLLLIGILGNSCIATALTTGTFVFYQERIGVLTRLYQHPTVSSQ